MTSALQLRTMLAVERAKTAFATNAYSGPMNPTIRSGASFMPPMTAPGLQAPVEKKAARFKLEGDAVIEVGKDGKSLGKGNVLEKRGALGGKLARLAATDIPGTPRMLMRQRSPEELANIEHGYDAFLHNNLHGPLKSAVEPYVQKIPHQGAQGIARKAIHTLIENPEALPLWAMSPPGTLEGYAAGKKLIGKGIDRLAPAARPAPHGPTILPPPPMSPKTAASAPTRGGFMQASDIPPFRAPSLKAPVEKLGDFLPDYVTYNPGDFKPARLVGKEKGAAGQNESIDENAGGSLPEDYRKKEKTSDLLDSAWGADTGEPIDSIHYLRGKEKKSSSSPMQAAMTAKTVGTFKPGKLPGPSIAEIAKPKGAGFGTGIAGAFKSSTGIGGTGPVSLTSSPGSLK